MKLLTFLGTAAYKITTYVLGDQRCTTCYCPAAVAHFCQPDTTLVVVTRDARAMHFDKLAQEIAGFTTPIPVPIPDGRSETDLWQIFEALTQQVDEKDELVVDITNGFRSLPFLSFLAVAFLRMARQVTVRHVYYGAWEARTGADESPIFDLTPFVTLLDWTIATDRFTRFGDASDLAALLKKGMPAGPLMGTDLQARALGKALEGSAQAMEVVSLALRLTRPLEAMAAGADLIRIFEQMGPLVGEQARPFRLLAEQIRRAYQPLKLAAPLERANWRTNLEIQLDMIKWYLEKGQIVQAVTLAREWLVSLLVYHFECASLIDYEQARGPVENALNNEVERQKPVQRALLQPAYDDLLQKLPDCRQIGQVWARLTNLRNDLAHCGMNPQPKEAQKLRRETMALYPDLAKLGQSFLAPSAGTGS